MPVTFKGAAVATGGELPRVGAKAPDFRLVDPKLQEVSLATYAGKVKIVTINPSVDTSVCAKTTRTFNEKGSSISGSATGGVVVLAISADLPFALRRFCAAEGLENVIALSTFRDPGFAAAYGVAMTDGPMAGLLARAVLVIDGGGVVRHVDLVSEIVNEPDYDAALAAATSLA